MAATSARRHSIPAHLRDKPDRQRTSALERFVIGWPVLGPVGWGCRCAHASRLPRWVREMNPLRDLCNKAARRHPIPPKRKKVLLSNNCRRNRFVLAFNKNES
jgi:hypothetical protein